MVLGTPTLHKRHADGAHLGQLVHRLEPVVDGLGQQGGELLQNNISLRLVSGVA